MTASIRRAALAFSMLAIAPPFAWAENNGQPPGAMPAAAPAATSGTCAGMTVIDHKEDSATSASTKSSAFVAVPNGTLAFTQGSAGCAIVTFSAETYAPYINYFLIARAVLDSGTVGNPGPVTLSGDDDENNNKQSVRTHGFTFVFPNVTAGAHSIAMQYRSFVSGKEVFLGKHSLTIAHP